jgi:hypothetical protein
MIYRRGLIKLFFKGDPTLKGCWSFEQEAIDESGNNNHGTINNTQRSIGRFNTGMLFLGTSTSYVNIPVSAGSSLDFAGKNQITIMVWAKALSSVTVNTDTFLGQDNAFFMRWNQNGGNNWGAGINNGTWIELSIPGTLNKWTFLVMTYNGSVVRFYKDGVLRNFVSTTGNITGSATKNITFGVFPTATEQRFNGILDEIAIFSRALSPSEISAYYKWAIGARNKSIFPLGKFPFDERNRLVEIQSLVSGKDIQTHKEQNKLVSIQFSVFGKEAFMFNERGKLISIQSSVFETSKRERPKQLIKSLKTESPQTKIENLP